MDWYYSGWKCPDGTIKSDENSSTIPAFLCRPPDAKPKACPAAQRFGGPNNSEGVGNPCSVVTGVKNQQETDYSSGGLTFSRSYNSFNSKNLTGIGVGWTHNFSKKMSFVRVTSKNWDTEASSKDSPSAMMQLDRGNGYLLYAFRTSSLSDPDHSEWKTDRDQKIDIKYDAVTNQWVLTQIITGTKEFYSIDGLLQRIEYSKGRFEDFNYQNNQLNSVQNQFGRLIRFNYNSNNQLAAITLPNNSMISYQYDGKSRLVSVSRPGYGTKTYHYSESSAPEFTALLTGITDENGVRFANYAYDSSGRTILTEHANSAQRFTLAYDTSSSKVIDPYGLEWTYTKTWSGGSERVLGVTRLGISTRYNTYDTSGNVISQTNVGKKTNYTYNNRNLETSRTEAVGKTQERVISTQWHPTLSVPTAIIESGRTTTYTYDELGNALSKTITDTLADPNISRTWSYTYDTLGLLLTETTPSGEISTYSYDQAGNLLTATNTLGQTTTYSQYNEDGLVGLVTDPNGREVTYTYDQAGHVVSQQESLASPVLTSPNGTSPQTFSWPQWLVDLINSWCSLIGMTSPFAADDTTTATQAYPSLSYASGPAITTYQYDPVGQLVKTTLPDGDVITFGYDDAHRLVRVTDQLGNTKNYTLNLAGDIIAVETNDAAGVLQRKSQAVYNNLGQLAQELGQSGQKEIYAYDDWGNVTSATDALGQKSSYTYDALNRKLTDKNSLNGTSQYLYNALDQLLAVIDPRNNATNYTYNAFDEVLSVQSPDTGLTNHTYQDGRLQQYTDARNINHSFSYDGLGRVTQRNDGGLITTFSYDQGTYAAGRLTGMSNADSTIALTYNSSGQVVEKLVGIKDKQPLRVRYSYSQGGKLKQIATPTGNLIEYVYNPSNGQVASLQVNNQTLLSQIRYGASGIEGWTWGMDLLNTSSLGFDLDGRLTQLVSANALNRQYGYDKANRIVNLNDPQAFSYTAQYSYDAKDRLTQQVLGGQTLKYSYDPNDNRLTQTKTKSGVTSTVSDTIASDSNRVTARQGSALEYLATGQITRDAARTYRYDEAGRLLSTQRDLQGVSYTYNALGQRIKKVSANNTIYFAYDELGQLLGEYDSQGTMLREYVWLEGRLVGMLSHQLPNQLLSIHTDHLGSVRAVSQGNRVLWRWDGDQFGDVLPNEDVDADGQVLTMPIRHPGQYADVEVGLFYNYYRDYDPVSGRYVESDPIGLDGGLNTYGYVGGSPILDTDFEGLAGGRGERGISGGLGGKNSDRPYKHCRELNPPDPRFIECKNPQMGKRGKIPRPPEVPFPEPKKTEACEDCQKKAMWMTGAGGTVYLIYRCIRMIPSAYPPLWPTIPANLGTP